MTIDTDSSEDWRKVLGHAYRL